MTELHELGEREVIRRLSALVGEGTDITRGIGDDAAVAQVEGSPWDWLLTTDPIIEGVHFLPDTAPERIGRKAVGRVLSDLAAMGGEPLWILFNLVAPKNASMEALEAVYRGAQTLASTYGAAIIGGDTAHGPVLELHAFAVGRTPTGSALLRSGARAGDRICVTGKLGGSLAGKHLDFEPRITEALWLREGGWPSAMMDISDGLGTDLRHIMEQSGVGAYIRLDDIPVSASAQAMSDGGSPVEHALFDGEDFELLFTLPPGRQRAFESEWPEVFDLPCRIIGEITNSPGQLEAERPDGTRHPLDRAAFDHFR